MLLKCLACLEEEKPLSAIFFVPFSGAELLVLSGIQKVVEHSREQGIDPVLFIESNSEALQAFSKTPKDLYQKILTLGFKKVEKIDEDTNRLTPIHLD